jgi:hypothetical protein
VVLKGAFQPFSVTVIAHGCSLEPNRLFQDSLDGPPQPVESLAAQVWHSGSGVNPGRKQDFVGIDVADSRDHVLVEQQGLDPAPAAGKERPETVGIQLQGLPTQPAQFHRLGRLRGDEHTDETEFPHIPEAEVPAGLKKIDNQIRVLIGRHLLGTNLQPARHLEMKKKAQVSRTIDQDHLAPPPDTDDFFSGQPFEIRTPFVADE